MRKIKKLYLLAFIGILVPSLALMGQTKLSDIGNRDGSLIPPGTVVSFAGSNPPMGWLLLSGECVSKTQYVNLFSVIGTTHGECDAGTGATSGFRVPDARGRVIAGLDMGASRLTTAGSGVDGATLGAAGGSQTHTLTTAEMPSHTHSDGTLATNTVGNHTHSINHDHASVNTSTDGAHGHATGLGFSATGDPLFIFGSASAGAPGQATVRFGGSFLSNNWQNELPTRSPNSSTNGDHNHSVNLPNFTGNSGGGGSHDHDVTGATGSAGSGDAHNNTQPTLVLNYIIKT